MKFRLSELKAQRSREHGRVTWPDIELATGIPRNMLIAMDQGSVRQIRPEYLDALARYFGAELFSLVELEPVELPLPGTRTGARTV